MSSSALKVEPVARAPEPSMEEILASIRKIISDDDSRPAAPKSDAGLPASVSPPGDDIDALLDDFDGEASQAGILDLTEEMAAPSEQLENTDLDFIDAGPFDEAGRPGDTDEPAPDPVPVQPLRTEMPTRPAPLSPIRPAASAESRLEDRLISTATDSAISAAFGSLTHTVLSANARTLDDLVQDMLRPMLKGWLDDNLPTLVERLVRAEIERVSRGGR